MIVSSGNTRETKTYETAEAGAYPARCIRLVDLGTSENTKFINEKTGKPQIKHEIEITFELSELMEDGRPFVASWRGSMSINEKSNLYKLLVAWRGKAFTTPELAGFDMKNVLDKPCMANINKEASKKDETKFFNKIISVMPLPKGMKCEERVNDLVMFELATDINNEEKLKVLWPFQRKIIEQSFEWKKFHGEKTVKDVVEAMIQNDPQSAPMTALHQGPVEGEEVPF